MYTLWKPARILQSKYVPEEVFPTDELERWAESNGYTKREILEWASKRLNRGIKPEEFRANLRLSVAQEPTK